MEASALIAVIGVVLVGASAAVLVPAAVGSAMRVTASLEARARLRRDVAGRADADGRPREAQGLAERAKLLFSAAVEGGIPPLRRVSQVLLALPPVRSMAELAVGRLSARGMRCTAESLTQAMVPVAVGAAVLLSLLLGSVALGVMGVAVAMWLLVRRMRKAEQAERQDAMRLLPDAVRALGMYYETGLSLMQAFEQVSEEMPEPLRTRLATVASDIRAGRSVEAALERFRSDVNDDAVSFVVVALEVQQRTGGALRPLLERAADGMVESMELRRFMEVHTAQARLSARVVALMPVAVFVVMSLVDPHYASTLLTSPLGLGLFAMACVFEVAGVVAIRRILASSMGDRR